MNRTRTEPEPNQNRTAYTPVLHDVKVPQLHDLLLALVDVGELLDLLQGRANQSDDLWVLIRYGELFPLIPRKTVEICSDQLNLIRVEMKNRMNFGLVRHVSGTNQFKKINVYLQFLGIKYVNHPLWVT